MSAGTPATLLVAVLSSTAGQMLVTFFNLSGVQVQSTSNFSVTVFKQ